MHGPCSIDFEGTSHTIDNFGGSRGSESTLRQQVLAANNCALARMEAELGVTTVAILFEDLSGSIRTSLEPLIIDLPLLTAGDHAAMLAIVANDGVNPEPALITRVLDADGTLLFERDPGSDRIVSSNTAAQLMDVMEANVRGGTGARARLRDATAAGLTGTVARDFSAAWFVGTANGLSTAIWVALPDGSPMVNIRGIGVVTGGSFPAQAWALTHNAIQDPTTVLPGRSDQTAASTPQPVQPTPTPRPLIAGSVEVETLPEVIACRGAEGTPPSNQGGPISAVATHPTGQAALEAFLAVSIEARQTFDFDAPGVVGSPPVSTTDYLELVLPDGSMAYAYDISARSVAASGPEDLQNVVTLISVIQVPGGWTVDRWEASGC